MRILLINAFHYLRGGVERTYLDESRWLAAAGHEVAHFATRDPRNLPSPTARFFAPPADYGEGAPLLSQIAQLPRVVWSAPAARAMESLLAEFRPEIAHLHAPSRYLTPSILRPLERAGVPTVMTLHDLKPWCTNRILFAHGVPCERCRGGAHWHAAATGCVQDSAAKSAVGTIEAYAHDWMSAYRSVRLWIAPSRFVVEKAVEWSVPRSTLRLLAHGVEANGNAAPAATSADAWPASVPHAAPFALYAGRLSVEKGALLLSEIARRLGDLPLVVAGDGPPRAQIEAAGRGIPSLHVLGYVSDATLAVLRARAAAVLVPSLFYEHFCYAAAEAMGDGRVVVASRIGAIPELVEHEVTGLLVPPGDADDAAAALHRALADPSAARWAQAGRERVRTTADPARHLEGLLAIYREAQGMA